MANKKQEKQVLICQPTLFSVPCLVHLKLHFQNIKHYNTKTEIGDWTLTRSKKELN